MLIGPRLVEQRMLAPVDAVGKAVIHALEANDFFASRKGARQSDGVDHGLRAGIAQAYLLNARHGGDDLLRQARLLGGRQREYRAAILDLLHHGGGHLRRAMSENHRTQAQQIVDVGVAVDIVEIGALAAIHEQGIGIPTRPGRTGGAVDAGGNRAAGLLVQFSAARGARGILVFHHIVAVLQRVAAPFLQRITKHRKSSHP